MKILDRLSYETRLGIEGSARGFVSTILGSAIFAVLTSFAFSIKNRLDNLGYEDAPLLELFSAFFILGIIFSFIPAITGGWLLASWITKNVENLSTKTGVIYGALFGGLSMFVFDFALGVLSLSTPHGPSIGIFLYYVISSTAVATAMGAWVSSQLTRKIKSTKTHQ